MPVMGWSQGAFEVVQTDFQVKMTELEAKVEGHSSKLLVGYKGALNKLNAKYQASGSLGEMLIIRDELTRLQTDQSVPDYSAREIPQDIARMMKSYESNYNKLKGLRATHSKGLIEDYVRELSALKMSLTREGKIEEATRAKKEADRVMEVYASMSPAPAAGSSRPGVGGGSRSGNGKTEALGGGRDPRYVAFKTRFPHLVSGLLCYYSFDGSDGSSVVDRSTNDLNDAKTKGISVMAGHHGEGVKMDENDSINFGKKSPLHSLKEGTFSFWVKTTASSGVMLSSYANNQTRGFRVLLTQGGEVLFILGGNYQYQASHSYGKQNTKRSNRAQSSKPVNDGKWHHVVVTRDKAKMYIFVDGEKGSSSFSENPLMDGDGDLRLNTYQYYYSSFSTTTSSSNEYYGGITGEFDDLMVFNRALNEQEIRSLYSLQR